MEAAPFLFWCIPHLGIVGGTAYSSLQKLIEELEGVSLGTVLAVPAQGPEFKSQYPHKSWAW